jgi:3-oxoacyl-[acyl-carrier protein] reductase
MAPHGITANLVAPATVMGTTMNRQLTAEQMHDLAEAP